MGRLQTLTEEGEPCAFCKLKEINELKYGLLYKRDGIVAHYYCVLFSSKTIQNGTDDQGMLGFLIKDIKTELKRVKSTYCCYCSKPNASISCCHAQCKLKFHFPCGISNNSLHQFKGTFKSYCFEHRPRQNIPEEYIIHAEKNKLKCVVCLDNVDHRSVTETIWARCCLKTWYHRHCMQQLALSTGYLFKCAICNNKVEFKSLAKEYGIYVPMQDASWELEPNAFSELLTRHCRCDANNCICPHGREYSPKQLNVRKWVIVLCKSCASHGTHLACSNLSFSNSKWECDMCRSVHSKLQSERKKRKSSIKSEENVSIRKTNKKSKREHTTGNENSNSNNVETGSFSQTKEHRRRKTSKRKRKNPEDNEKSNFKKAKLVEGGRMENKDPKTCFEEVSGSETAEVNTDEHKIEGANAENENEVVEIERISSEASDEEEEIIVDNSEASCAGSSNSNTFEKRAKDDSEQVDLIDLTKSNLIIDEEFASIIEIYRKFQMNVAKYHVKKEIYVTSDSESFDDDFEVIFPVHKSNESKMSKRKGGEKSSSAETSAATQEKSELDSGAEHSNKDTKADKNTRKANKSRSVENDSVNKTGEVELEIEIVKASNTRFLPKNTFAKFEEKGQMSGISSGERKNTNSLLGRYFSVVAQQKSRRNSLSRVDQNFKNRGNARNKRENKRERYKSVKRKGNRASDSQVLELPDSDEECRQERDIIEIVSASDRSFRSINSASPEILTE